MRRFITGSSLSSALERAEALRAIHKMPIFNFAVETNVSAHKMDTEFQQLSEHPEVARISLKCSLFGFNRKRIQTHVERMIAHNKLILVDAENDAQYDPYSQLTNQLIEQYNQQKVHIVKTYQMYRRDSMPQLQKELPYFQKRGLKVGVKLVRGAYFKEDISKRVLFYKKSDTDFNYNSALFYLSQVNRTGLNILATHNAHSVQLGRLCNTWYDTNFEFAHLLGMRESLYTPLIEENEIVNTYLPYGPYQYMLPYLGRRLYENVDALKHIIP